MYFLLDRHCFARSVLYDEKELFLRGAQLYESVTIIPMCAIRDLVCTKLRVNRLKISWNRRLLYRLHGKVGISYRHSRVTPSEDSNNVYYIFISLAFHTFSKNRYFVLKFKISIKNIFFILKITHCRELKLRLSIISSTEYRNFFIENYISS